MAALTSIQLLLKLCAEAQPVNEIENKSCINMTAERVKEIKNISEEIKIFINALADKYEDIDFLLFKINIENHSDEETDEKETLLKILVNDCKQKPLLHDGYSIVNNDKNNNDNEREHKSTTEVNNDNDINDEDHEDVSHFDTRSYNETDALEYKGEPVENHNRESGETTEEAIDDTQSEKEEKESELNNKDSPNEKNDSIVKLDDADVQEEGNSDSKLAINYNFNGNFDNTNLYISSAPKADPQLAGKSFEDLYNELYQLVFGNIKCKSPNANRNAHYLSPLQQFYDQRRGLDYRNYPREYYDYPNEIDDLWNILMEKLKRDYNNPENCVYALKKICGDFGENETNKCSCLPQLPFTLPNTFTNTIPLPRNTNTIPGLPGKRGSWIRSKENASSYFIRREMKLHTKRQ